MNIVILGDWVTSDAGEKEKEQKIIFFIGAKPTITNGEGTK